MHWHLILTISFATATVVAASLSRTYYKEENYAFRQRYIAMKDEKGHIRVEDLLRKSTGAKANITDVVLYLYTTNNPLDGERFVADEFANFVNSQYYSPLKKNVVIIHGWTGTYQSSIAVNSTAALFEKFDLNIFSIDWSGPADLFYTESVEEVPSVAGFLGDFLLQIINHHGITASDFVFIAHSLGAHVAGKAASMLGGQVDTIIGCDPAAPLFTLEDTESRLDTSDAQFVHVIHTNGGLLGFDNSIGHVDYYPNGGEKQPGCGVDVTGYCAHARSHEYLAESIASSGFKAIKCVSYEDFSAGLCDENEVSFMGGYPVNKLASGDYFLNTAETPPFALG